MVKQIQPSLWPRATAMVDIASVRPVIVKEPTLLGLTDAYKSVRPVCFPGGLRTRLRKP
jgi:hypothetical protein